MQKLTTNNGAAAVVQHYVNGVEYIGNTLERLPHTEGEVVKDGSGNYVYEYTLKDHLGNTRVTFGDADNNGIVENSDIKQINHYYPFGLNMEGPGFGAQGVNKYQFGEKELNTDFGLNWSDFGARWYDAAIGRFPMLDPLAGNYGGVSPYCYVMNRPTTMIDPTGMAATETEDRYTFTGDDAVKLFSDIQQKSRSVAPPGIYVNHIGEIMWNTSNNNKPNVYLLNNGQPILLGQIGGTINIDEIYTNLLEQNIAIAKGIFDPRTFRDYVTAGGIWDYKIRYNQEGRNNTIWGYVNIGTKVSTKFSFQGKDMEAQDIGNHHFGVVGKACGFPFAEETMLRQAGLAQMRDGTSKPEWQKHELIYGRYGVSKGALIWPYGDDPRDSGWIIEGFDYWKNRSKRKP